MAVHTIKVNVTERETQLVKLLADGNTLPEISKQTDTKLRTLEAKVSILKRKYQSQTLANLVAVFLRNKLID